MSDRGHVMISEGKAARRLFIEIGAGFIRTVR